MISHSPLAGQRALGTQDSTKGVRTLPPSSLSLWLSVELQKRLTWTLSRAFLLPPGRRSLPWLPPPEPQAGSKARAHCLCPNRPHCPEFLVGVWLGERAAIKGRADGDLLAPRLPVTCSWGARPSLLTVMAQAQENRHRDQRAPGLLSSEGRDPRALTRWRENRFLREWEPGQNPAWAFLLLGQALSLQTPQTAGLGGKESRTG